MCIPIDAEHAENVQRRADPAHQGHAASKPRQAAQRQPHLTRPLHQEEHC